MYILYIYIYIYIYIYKPNSIVPFLVNIMNTILNAYYILNLTTKNMLFHLLFYFTFLSQSTTTALVEKLWKFAKTKVKITS